MCACNLQFYGLVLRKSHQGDLLGNRVKNASTRANQVPCFASLINGVFKNSTWTVGCLLYILTAALEGCLLFKCCQTRDTNLLKIKILKKFKEKWPFTFIEQLFK